MTNEPLVTDPEEPKDVKKLVAAFQTVFEHQRGRVPNEGEVGEFLQASGIEEEVDKSEGDDEPAILHSQVIESKGGDPLFYLLPDDHCFDVEQGSWLPNVPSFVAELQARPMTRDDLVPMIIHGLIDSESFAALQSRGLVSKVVARLYEQVTAQQDLSKSFDPSSMDDFSSDTDYDLFSDEDFESVNNDDSDVEYSPLVAPLVGPNNVDELFRLAQVYTLDKRLEEAIRKIVRDEVGLTSVDQPVVDGSAASEETLAPEVPSSLPLV